MRLIGPFVLPFVLFAGACCGELRPRSQPGPRPQQMVRIGDVTEPSPTPPMQSTPPAPPATAPADALSHGGLFEIAEGVWEVCRGDASGPTVAFCSVIKNTMQANSYIEFWMVHPSEQFPLRGSMYTFKRLPENDEGLELQDFCDQFAPQMPSHAMFRHDVTQSSLPPCQ